MMDIKNSNSMITLNSLPHVFEAQQQFLFVQDLTIHPRFVPHPPRLRGNALDPAEGGPWIEQLSATAALHILELLLDSVPHDQLACLLQLLSLLAETGDQLDALLLAPHPFIVVGLPAGGFLHGVLPVDLLPVELFAKLLHVREKVVLEGLHLALWQVLGPRLAVRPALAKSVALVGIPRLFLLLSLILLDGLDEFAGLLGQRPFLLAAFLLVIGLLVLEGGVGDDAGLELVETQLIGVLLGLAAILDDFEGDQTLLSLLLADGLLVQHLDVLAQTLAHHAALNTPKNTISVHFSPVKATSRFSTGQQQKPVEAQIVQQWGTFRRTTALAVDFLNSATRKRQLQQRNMGVLLEMILGKIRVLQQLVSQMSYSGPQRKTFFFTECPCRSRNIINRPLNSAFSRTTNSFTAFTYGIRKSLFMRKVRFKSRPQSDVLKLPTTTPSGLSIGITLNTTFRRRQAASSESPQRYSRRPLAMKLEQDSPGWMRPDTRMHFLRLLSTEGSVTVRRGTSSPLNDSHRTSSFSMAE